MRHRQTRPIPLSGPPPPGAYGAAPPAAQCQSQEVRREVWLYALLAILNKPRVVGDRLVRVRGHWRGDPALGVAQSTYRLVGG